MTVEELDIIVQTNVEKAIKEFQKLLPAIKKQLSDIKKEFNKLDLKQVTADIDMSKVTKKIQQVKKHIKESFKEASNISINIKPKIQTSSKDNIGQENQLEQQTEQTGASQNKTTGFFNGFKEKIEQIKPALSKVNSMFGNIGNKIFKWINPMDIAKKSISNMHSKIKTMGNALKEGVVHILKQASSLIGLKNIYSTLSGCAQTWLSSQNSGAQQLSANIEYMKYSMGSVFAPVIEYVINLAYQLMKAIQSLVYAFSGINIFAKSTASSMGKTANNAKQASKSLSGVHGEINNVSESDSSGGGSGGLISPSMDLSQMENTPNTIIDAIKNGNWFEVGALIGEKLNNAMLSIPWDKIQNGAQNIASGIAQTLNGYIAGVDWNLAGNTLAQGLNTIIYFAYTFVTTFDWAQFGTAIGDSINGFFLNVDASKIKSILQNTLTGIIDFIKNLLTTIEWNEINEKFSGALVGIFILMVGKFTNVKDMFISSVGNLGTLIGSSFSSIGKSAEENLNNLTEKFGGHFSKILGKIVDFAPNFLQAFSSAFNIMAVIGLVVAGLGLLQENFGDQITNILNMIMEKGPEIISNLCYGITSQLPQLIEQGSMLLTSLLNAIIINLPVVITAGIDIICGLVNGISQQLPTLIPLAIQLIMTIVQSLLENLSTIIEAGLQLLVSLITGIVEAIPQLIEMLPQIVITICDVITEELPNIIDAGIKILMALIDGIIECIPKLVEMLPQIIIKIVTTLIENLPTIIDGGIKILIALIDGLIQAIPKLVEMLPTIISTIISTLIENYPKIIEAGKKILISLVDGIGTALYKIGEAGWEIIQKIGEVLKELPGKAIQWGKDMVQGFINGIKNMMGNIGSAAEGIGEKIKRLLHFSKPDEGPLRDYETWMPDMIEGLSKTLNQSAPQLYKASEELANNIANELEMSKILKGFDYTVNTDFIPTMQNLPQYTENIQPKNIIGETLNDILSSNQSNFNLTIPLTLNVGNRKLGEILLEDLRNMKRQTGKNIEALVN